MSKLKSLSVFALFFILPTLVWSQTTGNDAVFKQGTELYLKKDYEKAREVFVKLLDQDPNNATVLTNLALTEFQLGKKPLAVGLLRKALATEPDLTTAETGLKFVLTQMAVKEVPHQIETYETLRSNLLQPAPLSAYLVLSALSFFAMGWVLLSYGGRRKRALEEEHALPTFPLIGGILTLAFIAFTTLSVLKIYDSSMIRGTIVDEKVSLQTAPGDNQVAILELFGGMEVILRQTQDDWVQVTYPGALTGWIKKSSVMMTR